MILFLYGEDNYRLKQKLKIIKNRYLDTSITDANFSALSAEDNYDFEKIKGDIEAMPFLTDKRLVILENFLKQKAKKLQEDLKNYLDKIPEKSIVVFVEEGLPDQRTSLFKGLIKKAEKTWEFKPLKPYELEKWIKQTVLQNKGKIDHSAVQFLASYVDSNLWQMNNEIEKLILYKNKDIINVSDVELLVKAKMDTNIFNLIDALGDKNDQKAIQLLEGLLESGEPEVYILTMIIYQFRNILIIKDLLERGENKSEISKKVRMHPYVLAKTINQCKNFTLSRLKDIYQYLADTDLAIKTGKIESKIALNLLFVELLK
jgi:DNA polymerase-3 subunit delta